jgi:hypothetical protein
MRIAAILLLAAVAGSTLGVGLSFFGQPTPAAVHTPIKGKGPHVLVPATPADLPEATGAWAGTESEDVPPPIASVPASTHASSDAVYYAGCREVRAAGKAPLHAGEPGYREGMDGGSFLSH